MTGPQQFKELIALVADADTEYAVQALLLRHQALHIKPISFDIQRHPQRDAGCRSDCHNLLRLWLNDYQHAIVLFDHEGCGRENVSRLDLEAEVESRLHASGWADRCAVIVISPELETWIWSDSPVVDETLGWRGQTPSMRDWLKSETPSGAMITSNRCIRKKPWKQPCGRSGSRDQQGFTSGWPKQLLSTGAKMRLSVNSREPFSSGSVYNLFAGSEFFSLGPFVPITSLLST